MLRVLSRRLSTRLLFATTIGTSALAHSAAVLSELDERQAIDCQSELLHDGAVTFTNAELHESVDQIRAQMRHRIIGQQNLIDGLLIGLLVNGHILVEGAPGLAKTRTIKTLGDLINGKVTRFQFMADKMPSDIIGSEIFDHDAGQYHFHAGPIFTNLFLADEINRANSRTQSALFEAMEEKQVTVNGRSRQLDDVFFVMATQNPYDQEGTFKLPEALQDRFLLKIAVDYLTPKQEKEMLQLVRQEQLNGSKTPAPGPRFNLDVIRQARRQVMAVRVPSALEDLIITIVGNTRKEETLPEEYRSHFISGAGPRATIALDVAARAHAWLNNREGVTLEDIQAVANEVLRHRIALDSHIKGTNLSVDDLIAKIINKAVSISPAKK